jgi:hypothetical protein
VLGFFANFPALFAPFAVKGLIWPQTKIVNRKVRKVIHKERKDSACHFALSYSPLPSLLLSLLDLAPSDCIADWRNRAHRSVQDGTNAVLI